MSIRYTRYLLYYSTHTKTYDATLLLGRLMQSYYIYTLHTYSSSVRYFPSDHCLSHYSVQEPPRRCHHHCHGPLLLAPLRRRRYVYERREEWNLGKFINNFVIIAIFFFRSFLTLTQKWFECLSLSSTIF